MLFIVLPISALNIFMATSFNKDRLTVPNTTTDNIDSKTITNSGLGSFGEIVVCGDGEFISGGVNNGKFNHVPYGEEIVLSFEDCYDGMYTVCNNETFCGENLENHAANLLIKVDIPKTVGNKLVTRFLVVDTRNLKIDYSSFTGVVTALFKQDDTEIDWRAFKPDKVYILKYTLNTDGTLILPDLNLPESNNIWEGTNTFTDDVVIDGRLYINEEVTFTTPLVFNDLTAVIDNGNIIYWDNAAMEYNSSSKTFSFTNYAGLPANVSVPNGYIKKSTAASLADDHVPNKAETKALILEVLKEQGIIS